LGFLLACNLATLQPLYLGHEPKAKVATLIFKASLDKKWVMEMYKNEGNNHVAK
jgi:hypothetical protein